MENDNLKKEIMPLFANLLILPYEENPYVKTKTDSGLIITDGQFDNPDSGQRDMKDLYIECGHVIEVGPECKYVKVGDDVFYDCRSMRPVPFMREGFLIGSEINLVAIMNDDLKERLYGNR